MSRITENIFKVACFLIVTLMVCVMPLSAKNKFTVVIDPGHGGKDTGAVADDKKTLEKDINLQVALKLGEILKKKKGFKVVYTRNSDKFIGLNDRADKANKEKADIFVSIHTNSLDANNASRKTAEGAQVYVLGLHRDADNLAVARRENSVIVKEKGFEETYENFDPDKDESYIIFEMAQKKNLSNSIGLAQDIEKELVKAGRKDRGVHQAGFLVLRETAMPSVLVELDFICNPNSAKYMSTSAGQKKLATAIANAIVTYRNNIEKRGDKAYQGASLDGSDDGSGVYVLTSLKSVERKDHAPSTRNARKAGERRRRSVAAARQSSQRDLSTDNIIARKEYTGVSVNSNDNPFYGEEPAEEKHVADNSASVKKDKKSKKGKNKNKKKDEKKEKASDEVVTRTYGGKTVVVKHVQPGSSSVVSLKSSKDRKEKRADSARFVPDTPTEEQTASGKGIKLVDKKAAASRAAEKEQAVADKKAGKSLKSKKNDDEKKLREQEEKARKAEEKRLAEEKKQQKKLADAKSAKKSSAKKENTDSGKDSSADDNSRRYEEVKQKAAESKTVPAVKSLKRKKRNR